MRRGGFELGWIGSALLSCWLFLVVGGAVALTPAIWPSTAVAQADNGAASGTGGSAAPTESDQPQSENMLTWLIKSLGWRYVIAFLFITFNLVALIVMNSLAVRRDNMIPPALITNIEANLEERRLQETYELVQQNDSFLGRVLTAGLTKAQAGYDQALEAMQETGDDENLRLEQRLSWVALIAQVAPMVGLLGTVDGMVQAFDVIAHSNVTPKPSQLAQGIGTALVTTLVGLVIAIPTLAFHHFIRNRINRYVFEAGTISEDLLKRFFAAASGPPAKKS